MCNWKARGYPSFRFPFCLTVLFSGYVTSYANGYVMQNKHNIEPGGSNTHSAQHTFGVKNEHLLPLVLRLLFALLSFFLFSLAFFSFSQHGTHQQRCVGATDANRSENALFRSTKNSMPTFATAEAHLELLLLLLLLLGWTRWRGKRPY